MCQSGHKKVKLLHRDECKYEAEKKELEKTEEWLDQEEERDTTAPWDSYVVSLNYIQRRD